MKTYFRCYAYEKVTNINDDDFGSDDAWQNVTNEVLSKTGDISNGVIAYTINVNRLGYTLNNGKPLTLTDTMDSGLNYYISDTLPVQVLDKDGKTVTGVSSKINSDGHLEITGIPDSQYVQVKYYATAQNGTEGGKTNTAVLKCDSGQTYQTQNTVNVSKSSSSGGGETATLIVKKTDADDPNKSLPDAEFQIDCYSWDTNGNLVEDTNYSGIKGSTDKNGSLSCNVPLDELVVVTETKAPKGYELDSTPHYCYYIWSVSKDKDTVKGLIDKLGDKWAALKKQVNDSSSAVFKTEKVGDISVTDNVITTKATIRVQKDLEGRSWQDGDAFEFTLSAAAGAADDPLAVKEAKDVPMPFEAGRTATVTGSTKDHTASFGEITYSKAGNYYYTVRETKPSDTKGITYDENAHTVIVKVTDGGAGNLSAVPYYGTADADRVTVTNTYKAAGSITFAGTKRLENGEKNGKTAAGYTFTIKEEGKDKSYSAESDETGKIKYPEISYTLADVGEHTYTVRICLKINA